MPKIPETTGFLKSASTRSVLHPLCARVIARLIAAVDLPSPADELLTRMVFMPFSRHKNLTAVRKVRKLSANVDFGAKWVNKRR